MLLFTLGNSSDAFLILRANNVGISSATIPLVIAFFNLVSAMAAIPAGRISDRIGRCKAISIGWVVYAAVYLGFALVQHSWMIWPLYGFYGLYYAFTEGSAKAMVAERESLHQLIQNTLLELEEFSKTVNIKPLIENLEGNIMGDMTISWESLEESRSRRMTGYGALNPLVKEITDPAIDHFAKIALEICNLTMPRAPEEMTDVELWP